MRNTPAAALARTPWPVRSARPMISRKTQMDIVMFRGYAIRLFSVDMPPGVVRPVIVSFTIF